MKCKLAPIPEDKTKQPSVCIMLEDIETELVFLDSHASRSGTEDTEADCTLVIFRLGRQGFSSKEDLDICGAIYEGMSENDN